MKNIIVVTFNDSCKAYQALSTVKELNESGRLSLEFAVVVERQRNGRPVVRDNTNVRHAFDESSRLIDKMISGLSGSTERAAIADQILFGTTALIASVNEYAVEAIDGAMGQLGGVVAREATDNVAAELKASKDAASAAEKKETQEEREAHRLERERERAEQRNERLDRTAHWVEDRKEPVPPQPVSSTEATTQD